MDNYEGRPSRSGVNTGESTAPFAVSGGGAIDEDAVNAATPPLNITDWFLNKFVPRPDRPGVERGQTVGAGDPTVRLVVPGEGVYALDPTAPAVEPANITGLLVQIRDELRAMNNRRSSRIAATMRKFTVDTGVTKIVEQAYDRPAPAKVLVLTGGPIFVNAGTEATTDDWPVNTGIVFEYSGDEPLYATVATATADVRVWQEVTR